MIESTVLDNGIRVTTETMPGSRSIAVGILVSAGPRDERDDKAGLAHLTEHALFHGTSCRSEAEISRLIDTVGGKVSAFTGRDYTCFSAVVMDDHLPYILDLFSDMLLNSIFPEQRLESERQVILAELAAGRDLPHERVLALLKASVWPDHPLGRDIEGRAETIRGLSREDVIYFLHGNYLPNRISVALAGNLQHDDAVAKVHDCLWRLVGEVERSGVGPGPFRSGTSVEDCPSRQAYFALGIPAPAYTAGDRYGIHLLTAILGGGLSSRLYRNLREEQGLVYDIHSEYHAYLDAGMVVVAGSTLPGQLTDTIALTVEETLALLSLARPPHSEEIWRAQLRAVGQHHIDSEDPYTRMSRLLTQQYYFGRVIPADEIVAGLRAVDQQALADICRRSLSPARQDLALAVVGPAGAGGESFS